MTDALLIFKGGVFESRHEILPEETIIGRAGHVRIFEAGISRRHVALRRREKDVVVVDLGSSYGTTVNKIKKLIPASEIVLHHGDVIELPGYAIHVLLGLTEEQIALEVEKVRPKGAPLAAAPPPPKPAPAPRPAPLPSPPAPAPVAVPATPPGRAEVEPTGAPRVEWRPPATPDRPATPDKPAPAKPAPVNPAPKAPVVGLSAKTPRAVISNELAAVVLARPMAPEVAGFLPPGAEVLSVEQWLLFELFEDCPPDAVRKFLARTLDHNQHPIWVRRFKKGETICHEGEHGSTAFYILRGKVKIFITSTLGHAKSKAVSKGFLQKLSQAIFVPQIDETVEWSTKKSIAIDAQLSLDMNNPSATLGDGDLFGEMTCISLYPRSATVVAEEDTVCFEMLRSVLLELLYRRSKAFKEKLDAAYRERALTHQLRNVSVFYDLPQEFLDSLKSRVELVGPFDPGDVICKQGDPSDALYVIRLGFVRVAQTFPGGDLVLAYLGVGQCFGEIGLLEGAPRNATCTALDHVELVKINKADFENIVTEYPQVRRRIEGLAKERKTAGLQAVEDAPTIPLDAFLNQGLMNAKNVLLLDLEKCTRCDECVKACADTHEGVSRLSRDGLRFDKYLVATSCRACTDPVCMIGCPVGSIRRRDSLEIIIEDWCIGCGKCAQSCPYGNINMTEFPAPKATKTGRALEILPAGHDGKAGPAVVKKATTCDLCTDIGGDPSCVYACPHGAALRVEPRKFFGLNRSR